ncbi:MAG TPA: hypothetical protein VK817_17085 [Trebonia sp.]|nr:hypothetical protein [Trebonia sp.]
MRTEDDLRAALASLEDQAPLVTRVLARIPRNGSRGITPRPLSPIRMAGLAAGLAAAIAIGTAAAVIATQSPGAVVTQPGSGTGSHPQALPAHEVLRAKVLDALSSATSEIVYVHTKITASTISGLTGTPDPYLPSLATGTASEIWYYPWRAQAGQQVRGRELTLHPDGSPAWDVGFNYPEPTEVQEVASGELTQVNYAHHTHSEQHSSGIITDGDTGSPLSLWELIHNEPWSIAGRTELDGQSAIKLKFKGSYLWVNAHTYQPLRETSTFGGISGYYGSSGGYEMINGKKIPLGSGQATFVSDYEYLAPTAANLAKLTVPIPKGFR